jgi:hypothetical protein
MNTVIQQRGFSIINFLIWAILLILLVIFGLKLIPAYMEDAKITNLFNEIKHDPDLSRAGLNEMRSSFATRAVIDNVTAIKPEQIQMTDTGIITAQYKVIIPVGGNISLLLEFNPHSAQ